MSPHGSWSLLRFEETNFHGSQNFWGNFLIQFSRPSKKGNFIYNKSNLKLVPQKEVPPPPQKKNKWNSGRLLTFPFFWNKKSEPTKRPNSTAGVLFFVLFFFRRETQCLEVMAFFGKVKTTTYTERSRWELKLRIRQHCVRRLRMKWKIFSNY